MSKTSLNRPGYRSNHVLFLNILCILNHHVQKFNYVMISIITQLSASYSILTKSHISHLKMDPMWVAVVFETILHSPEMDPKILYPTLQKWILKNYFPLSQHESTLHNIYIQNFWSLGNADTPLLTRGIWKYLFWVAVVFETIYHSGFALVEYGFKYHCYPQKIFSYPTR